MSDCVEQGDDERNAGGRQNKVLSSLPLSILIREGGCDNDRECQEGTPVVQAFSQGHVVFTFVVRLVYECLKEQAIAITKW